ncbi:SDR family oxidoreductase [Fusobacterium nucleatum]|uniref:SDR family NAD(P)-dependent oxidoreductase n=1 Tax=Fusobacterium nucleatum TaxID=851 RepID=UPI003D086536
MKVFIVGGSSGIGLSLAKRYTSLGNEVAICGTNEEKLRKIKESGVNIKIYKADVRDKEELKSVIDDFSKGDLDLIINSAGVYTNNRTAKLTDEQAYAMIDINLTGTLNTFEAVRDMMFKNNKGHIAIVSSIAGLLDYPKASVYARTKMTIMGVCETYRAFFRNYNINITTIVPGYIATDKLKSLRKDDITNKPTVLSEEQSTDIIIKAIEEKKEKIIYPLSMKILISIITKLPKKVLTYILIKQANWGKK